MHKIKFIIKFSLEILRLETPCLKPFCRCLTTPYWLPHYTLNSTPILWRRGVVVITTAQLHAIKPELRFCAGSWSKIKAQTWHFKVTSTMLRVFQSCYAWQNLDCLDFLFEKERLFEGHSLLFYSIINLGAKLRVTWCEGYTTLSNSGLKLR